MRFSSLGMAPNGGRLHQDTRRRARSQPQIATADISSRNGARLATLAAGLLLLLLWVGLSAAHAGNRPTDGRRLKVAALASKLEHWLACHRLNQELEHEALLLNRSFDGCHAHFDGHLCWPPAKANETLELPCPILSWLLEEPTNGSTVISLDQGGRREVDKEQETTNLVGHQQEAKGSLEPATGRKLVATRSCLRLATNGQHKAHDGPLMGATINLGPEERAQVAAGGPNWQPEADYGPCQGVERASNQLLASGQQADKMSFDPTDQWVELERSPGDRLLFERLVDELDRIESNPYSDPDIREQWTDCIGLIMDQHEMTTSAAGEPATGNSHSHSTSTSHSLSHHHHKQQQQTLASTNPQISLVNNDDPRCPVIFDGWRCWPSTGAAQIAYANCPKNQPGFIAEGKAHKICMPDGTWYRHPETNRVWSNYTSCVDINDLAFRTKINRLYVSGNLISLIALVASLIIFISFKSLNCTRVTIHKNLFMSFIANNVMWVIWYNYIVSDADLLRNNPIGCQILHILLHYFLVSNYFWMFCEGLYLHTLLVVAFVSEDKILKWFYLLGWIWPIPITATYAYNRHLDSVFTNYCWMDESPHNLILMAPIGISLLLNLVFLINIVRVLVTKLRANNSPDAHQTRKAVRATLILIPLLGLHYMLTPFRPEPKSEWEVIYESVAAICTSFQGLCVALLFCFCNGEVLNAINRKLKDTLGWSNQGARHRGDNLNFHLAAGKGVGGQGAGKFGLLTGLFGRSQKPVQRCRSNTTCTVIGLLSATGGERRSDPAAVAAASDMCPGAGRLARGSMPALALTHSHRANCSAPGTNSSNSSSLLTTVTASPPTVDPDHAPELGLARAPDGKAGPTNGGPCRVSGLQQGNSLF